MTSLWKRSVILVCLVMALALGSPAAARTVIGQNPEGQAAQAERRAEARRLVARLLEQRSVRAVEPAVIQSDARRIVASLSDEQVEAYLGGEDLVRVISRGPVASPEADGGLQNTFAPAIGDAESELLFVPVSPCRILDTRLAGGALTPGVIRSFEVVGTANFAGQGGNAAGCGVPQGAAFPLAASVVVNFVAVGPAGPGHLEAWEFGQPIPTASVINYANVPGLNIANGVVVPIAGVSSVDKDMHIRANVSGTHVVADVTGYFTRFPNEEFQGNLKSTVAQNDVTQNPIDLGSGACQELNSCSITAGSHGTAIIEVWGQAVVGHTSGTMDVMELRIEDSAVACDETGMNVAVYEVSGALGSSPDVDFVVSLGRSFNQTAGTTKTYRLSGRMTSGFNSGAAGDKIENSRLICTFIPD